MPVKKSKGKSSFGLKRARRARTGENKILPIRLTEGEKARIERAAAKAGVSLSRFIVEHALSEAERVLSKSQ